jgi:predicted amidohydrolase
LAQKITGFMEDVDLIVLPEMFSSGFTMNPKAVAETMQGETVSWLQHLAKAKDCAITGSLVIEENGNYYNRLVFVFPTGEIKTYDKKHLFSLAGENEFYAAGKDKLILEYKGYKICPLICYDLRFPVFSRNVENYDVLLYVANWPKPRVNAWDILLKARSVENMCYTIGVNRIGKDHNHHEYVGHTQVIDFLGEYVLEPQEADAVFIVELNKAKLLETRRKLAFLNDKDNFQLETRNP